MMEQVPSPPTNAMTRLMEALGADRKRKGPPPVERWNPAYCGEIDMRIAADGAWYYMGTPIGRPALVRLFASVLRKDPERYVLVTPVERVGIAVDDVPFLAVEMAVDGEGGERRIVFRTNVDDLVEIGPDHPLRFEVGAADGVKPYLRVRGDLWARLTRSLTLDLIALGEEMDLQGERVFGIRVGGQFFPVTPADRPDGRS